MSIGLGALAGRLGVLSGRPLICTARVVRADRLLFLTGRNFGAQASTSAAGLDIWLDGQQVTPELLSWSDLKIAARLPEAGVSGTVQVVKRGLLGHMRSNVVPFVQQAAGLPSGPFDYEVPVQREAPWPSFRRDHRNSANSPISAHYHGDLPWTFATGKGIFSTPVIDWDGAIYIGSGDHNFYALNPDGSEKWRVTTGEVIDSAGILPMITPAEGCNTVTFPSGDGYLYHVCAEDGEILWGFDAREMPRADSYNNWFEGNVGMGFDGTYYVGNTNFNYYAISPDGQLKWTYETGANAWSMAAIGEDGTIFWGSNDSKIHAVRPDGSAKWKKRTLGFIAASAAIGSDGTVYIGSFDSYLYALDPETGKTRWRFKTGDHIYASAALGRDEGGRTNAIYVGSTDGRMYALSPAGKLLWRYDTGAPIRSSPVIGQAPKEESDEIIYFGAGNGKLYALNSRYGARRWSYDTTPAAPEQRDRNDLNGSPALGLTGVYIGGEHGQVCYVPYDYPLHVADPRASTALGEDLPVAAKRLYYVSPGGNRLMAGSPVLSPATMVTLRLGVRERDETIDARLYNAPVWRTRRILDVQIAPPIPFKAETSADGRHLHIVPDGFLTPGETYAITVAGNYYTGGLSIGNLTLGGRKAGRFEETVQICVAEHGLNYVPLRPAENRTPAFEWTRLAVPIPPMLPSLNQLGFDYMDWIIGAATLPEPDGAGKGRCVMWAIGGRRDADGLLVADPESDFTLPFSGRWLRDAFILENRSFTLRITGIPIPFNFFQLRGQMDADLRARPGATAYADTQVLSIPTFGPLMVLAGLANNWWQKLLAAGTFETRPYEPAGPANRRPPGFSVTSSRYRRPTGRKDGLVVVRFELEDGCTYPLDQHRPGIVLMDPELVEAVYFDYHTNLQAEADARGNLAAITLRIPAGTTLPPACDAIVMLDVFPLHRFRLTEIGVR